MSDETEDDPGVELLGNPDAEAWAREFTRLFIPPMGLRKPGPGDAPASEIDMDLMRGWFANAIETGKMSEVKAQIEAFDMDEAVEAASSELRLHTRPGVFNNRQAVEAAAELLSEVGGYDDIATSLRTSAAERFPDEDSHEGILTSAEAARAVVDAALPLIPSPLGRLERFLRKHPRELVIVSFRPPREATVVNHEQSEVKPPGEFFFSSQFGEEAPAATFEARRDEIRAWVLESVLGKVDVVSDVDDDAVRDLLTRLDDVNSAVFAGGAIYGADPTLAESIHIALKDARS